MPSIYGKPQNVSRWIANIEYYYKPRTGNSSPVSGMGELILALPCSLQLRILLSLAIEDFSSFRLVSRSFKQLAKKYTDAVSFRDPNQEHLMQYREESWFYQPRLLTVENVGNLSRGSAVPKELDVIGHPVLLSRDIEG
ncbi:hypothetical protein MMC26_005110 [Xylographa opegraphella]|nr:hypothetical protein [Xylographa opegraphella]